MTALRGATVLMTGAGGFVGPHLARALAAAGARVHGLGLGAPPRATPIESWQELDLADTAGLGDAIASLSPAAIVHLAGQSSAARSFEAPDETFRANVLGTWGLLDAVRTHAPRARVIAVITSEIYGPIAPGTRAAESTPFKPLSPYGFSKAAADQVAAAFAEAHGLDVVRARPFGHTGPGQSPAFVIPGWAQQVAAIEAGQSEPILRVGNLEVTRDLSDVRDVAEGYCALIEHGRTGAAYNLCRGEGAKLTDVLARITELATVPVRVEVDPARLRPADLPYLVGDPELTASDCNWRATRPLDATLTDVLAEWRAQ